ncbi:uncharacterized protein LODBEIA_P09280 [Lodderomyces beijingensis]|uniref:Uncharacterized protein n=1 Tax=Lodderomyces beijingensis TaxID=1775926 RepID=A0ABP0ZEW7_9ASCO
MDGTTAATATYICIKPFNARLGDELTLKIGDKIQVLADDREYNDGWYMGKNLLTGDVGLYPKTFTSVLEKSNDQKTLLRSRSRRVLAPPQNSNKNGNATATGTNGTDGTINTSAVSVANGLNNDTANKPMKSYNGNYGAEPGLKLNKSLEKLNIKDNSTSRRGSQDSQGLSTVNNNNNSSNGQGRKSTTASAFNSNSNSNSNTKAHKRDASTQSLTYDLNPLQALSWTPKQVSSYFALVLGFDKEVASKFVQHKITGPILFELDLGHLKELDINSFGTRFEIHKEVEKLREMNARSAKLKQSRTSSQSTTSLNKNEQTQSTAMSSPTEITSIQDQDQDDKLFTSSKAQLMPSAVIQDSSVSSFEHQRAKSQSMENLTQHYDSSFMSPRKAPQPPPPSSSLSPMDTNFKFGGGAINGDQNSQQQSSHGLYMTRTNASSNALNSRPASSVYDQGSHIRQQSQTSNYRQQHHRNNSGLNHRRHSSMFSFLSNGNDDFNKNGATPKQASTNKLNDLSKENFDDKKLISPAQIKREIGLASSPRPKSFELPNHAPAHSGAAGAAPSSSLPVDIDDVNLSPKKDTIGALQSKQIEAIKDDRRVASDPPIHAQLKDGRPGASRFQSLRKTSTQNFKNLTGSKKSKTSAFTEGIREISPDEAIKTANYSGSMSKRSGSAFSWKTRYFTLHGTRLSYFTSLKDKREKGLIDITAHKVVSINSEADDLDKADKYAAMYASTTLAGNYCFKLVPPAPGFKKGLTFTQPKTHYFAVETEEEMRGWIKALMTATIDIDDSVPVVSSCSTPTVTLLKAQELLAKAREENKLKDEELRAKGYIRGDEDFTNDSSFQTSMYASSTLAPERPSKLSIDTSAAAATTSRRDTSILAPPLTPSMQSGGGQGGFASPYLLASGYMSPRSGSPAGTPGSVSTGYFADNNSLQPSFGQTLNADSLMSSSKKNLGAMPHSASSSPTIPQSEQSPASNNFETKSPSRATLSRAMSGSRKKEKMMAYSSDSSGNHTFVIKAKR